MVQLVIKLPIIRLRETILDAKFCHSNFKWIHSIIKGYYSVV